MGAPVQGGEKGTSRERMEAPLASAPPIPSQKAPTCEGGGEEAERWVEEAKQLEDVGRLLSLLPTQQLAQMAVEAGPSDLGREEPVRRKLQPIVGGKGPPEGIPLGWKGKKDQEVPVWHSCSLRGLVVPKEH